MQTANREALGPIRIHVIATPIPHVHLLGTVESRLRNLYDGVVNEPVPAFMVDLVRQHEEASLEEAGPMAQMLKAQRVALVVEDDTDIRDLAVALLEETELRVQQAASAEEALQYLREHGGDVGLLFADVKLPCLMNGVDLARTVRLNWPWVRTILTSGAPLDDDAGVPREVRFIPKPWRALDVLVEAEKVARAA